MTKNLAIVAFVTLNVFISGFFISSILNRQDNRFDGVIDDNAASRPKAAIVDQSTIIYPNKSFIKTATGILEQAGYSVDYYSYENVTVKFYENLAVNNYKLIILRIHSSLQDTTGYVTFFTSERYNKSKYIRLQLTDQLVVAWFSPEDIIIGDTYFGINNNFVTRSMKGRFNNTIIIMMGCDGLTNTQMAKAFVEKGAKVYVGWKVPVSIIETDKATIHLLRHFITEKTTLEESVRQTFNEIDVGPDYNNQLTYYPAYAGRLTIEKDPG